MSSIHEALTKAQKEKEAGSLRYRGVVSGSGKKPGGFSGRALWLISIFFIVLVFALYSWLHFRDKNTIVGQRSIRPVVSPEPPASAHTEDFHEQARHLHRQGRLPEAKLLYEKALTLDPGNVYALNNLGVIYMQEGNYTEAKRRLDNAIGLKPDYVDPYYNSACLYALSGEKGKGLASLRKAVSLDASVRQWAQKDRDLQSLRGAPEFKEMMKTTQ